VTLLPVRIDQFLPSFVPHDAIGNHVLQVRRVLRDSGVDSEIWAEHIHPALAREARPYPEFADSGIGRGEAILVYHASTHSPMAAFLGARPERLVVDYHNITPARFFARWEPVAASSMELARMELGELTPRVELGLADSGFNEAELVELGYRRTAVQPLLIDFADYDIEPKAQTMARLGRARRGGGARWLFVGRLAPNKCQHDVIGAFAAYRRIYDPAAHLTLIGGVTAQLYLRALQGLVAELELGDSVEVLPGCPFDELVARYRTADVFVCLSEHEGFCVPILEAMHFDVPVVAYRAAAVPDTVAGAGVLLDDKDPLVVASAVDRVLTDNPLRSELAKAGRERVEEHSLPTTSKRLLATVSGLVDGGGRDRI